LPADLVQLHRIFESFWQELATVSEDEGLAREEMPDRCGNEDLATLRLCGDTRCKIHTGAEVISFIGDRLTGIQAYPHMQGLVRR
jgi:hypothetical protein